METETISVTAEIMNLVQSPEKLKTVEKQKKLSHVCEWFSKHPREFNPTIIAKMKHLGMKRPEWIPKNEWQGKKKQFESKGELIARLAACGLNSKEIAKRIDMNEQSVGEWMRDPEIKKRIYECQNEIFGGDPRKLFRSALYEAFNTELAILRKDGAKDSVKLNAAQDLMDRAAGKAPQEINVNDSNIRNLIERLDKIERLGGVGAIEVPSLEVQDAQFSEVRDNQEEPAKVSNTVEEPKDAVDRWLAENEFCQNGSTGQKT